MARIVWKEGAVISVETRRGTFVVAQMLMSPYLMFYNIFNDSNKWGAIELENTATLFCKPVTRQFLKMSSIIKLPKIKPNMGLKLPTRWVKNFPGKRKVTIWKGTELETELISLAGKCEASLIENNITVGGFRQYPVVANSIQADDKILDAHESTSISIYPELNERLYLCYKLDRNIDPAKNIDLERDLPFECKRYVDIISGKIKLSELGY